MSHSITRIAPLSLLTGLLTVSEGPGSFGFRGVPTPPSPQGQERQESKLRQSFYVATDGNDAWSGTLPQANQTGTDGPFATVARARDAIRKLKDRAALTEPFTVYLRGGTYGLSEPMVFLKQDSGTETSPTIYKAYEGEQPVLSGGRDIGNWRPVDSAGDFPDAGIGAPSLQENLWMTQVPGIREGHWDFHQFFVDGQRRQLARTPSEGYFLVDGQISTGDPAQFRFHPGDLHPDWVQSGNARVAALLAWGGFFLKLRGVDPMTSTATLAARRPFWGSESNPRYWVENLPQALDAPGEWYLDRQHGVLYYHSMPGENMSKVRAIAPHLRTLVFFKGDPEWMTDQGMVKNVIFDGLTFSYTDSSTLSAGWTQSHFDWSTANEGYIMEQAVPDVPAAVYMSGAHSCSITKSVFTHLGGHAIHVHGGSAKVQVTRNLMTDLGAGGVMVGDRFVPLYDEQASDNHSITDNTIHNIGVVYPAGEGIWIGASSGNLVAHNEIRGTRHNGISVGWTWGYGPSKARNNVIEFNHIQDVGQGILSDLGCIYTLGVQPGTVIRNNICHNVRRKEEGGYGGWGIYTDEGSSQILIENNIVYNTEDGSYHHHFGENNIIRNNIFALSKNVQLYRSRTEERMSFVFERNIVYWKDGKLLAGKWDDGNFKCDYNLYFREGDGAIDFAGKSFKEWQAGGKDVHSRIASPMFTDPERGDFSLQAGSPAFAMGFKAIDVSRVGPRKLL